MSSKASTAPKIGILGCGHLGGAIAQALLREEIRDIWLTNRNEKRLVDFLQDNMEACGQHKTHLTTDNISAAEECTYLFLCAKPSEMKDLLTEIRPALKKRHVLISVAAGVTLINIKKWSKHKKVVRVMPNLGIMIGLGMSAWRENGLESKEKKSVMAMLQSFGQEIEVKNDKMIDAATAISGSGPAYVFAVLESLEKAGKALGFTIEEAQTLALMTAYGSTVYASNTDASFKELLKMVETKGGTTEAALKVLKAKKWQGALVQAVKAAEKRAGVIAKKH